MISSLGVAIKARVSQCFLPFKQVAKIGVPIMAILLCLFAFGPAHAYDRDCNDEYENYCGFVLQIGRRDTVTCSGEYYMGEYIGDVTCGCSDPEKELSREAGGCVCMSGYYGLGGNEACNKCPDNGLADSGGDNKGGLLNGSIEDCYKIMNNVSDSSAHATLRQMCFYKDGSYSDCTMTSIVRCEAGYYRVNASDLSCVAVGVNYYSVSPFSRQLCESYTNPSGGASYGQTSGYGTDADAKTDCKIPGTEVFTDTTGSWNYDYGGCPWSN